MLFLPTLFILEMKKIIKKIFCYQQFKSCISRKNGNILYTIGKIVLALIQHRSIIFDQPFALICFRHSWCQLIRLFQTQSHRFWLHRIKSLTSLFVICFFNSRLKKNTYHYSITTSSKNSDKERLCNISFLNKRKIINYNTSFTLIVFPNYKDLFNNASSINCFLSHHLCLVFFMYNYIREKPKHLKRAIKCLDSFQFPGMYY